MLLAFGIYAQRGEDNMVVDMYAVDHEHDEVDAGEVTPEPRTHLLLRRGHEAPADGAVARTSVRTPTGTSSSGRA